MDLNTLNAKIIERVDIAEGLMTIKVTPNSDLNGGNVPSFKAGQYATLGVLAGQPRHPLADPEKSSFKPKGWESVIVRRPYTITSSANERDYVELYVSLVKSGAVTPKVFTLEEGSEVFLSESFGGLFTLDDVAPDNNLILACTGTGVAPYISFIRTNPNIAENKKVTLVHGVRHSSELAYRAELKALDRADENFTYIPIISRELEEPTHWEGQIGHVQDILCGDVIEELTGSALTPDDTSILLCGNPEMISDTIPLLEKLDFTEHKRKSPGNIHTEKYW